MPRFCLALAAVFFAFGLLCPQVCAAGNVLVPSDDDSSLDGQQSKNTPAPSSEDSESPSLPASDYAPTSPPDTSKPQIDAPKKVMEVPAPTPESTRADAGLAGSLAIGMAKENSWGPGDIAMIQRVIGISPTDVPKRCALSASGMVRSNSESGIYPYDFGAMSDTFVNYNGKIKDISVRLHALCELAKLPPNAGYVVKVGDKYSIYLNSINCTPPPENVQHISINYAGDGAGKCIYE